MEGVMAVADLKKVANVTAEVTPHHLLLTKSDLTSPNRKFNPPIGDEEDRKALIEAVRNGTIDALASDHAPHPPKPQDLEKAPFGSACLEVAFSGYYTALGDLELVLTKMTASPLRIIERSARMSMENLVVIDPDAEFVVDTKEFAGGGKNCALEGMRLKGKVLGLRLGGRWLYWDGEFLR